MRWLKSPQSRVAHPPDRFQRAPIEHDGNCVVQEFGRFASFPQEQGCAPGEPHLLEGVFDDCPCSLEDFDPTEHVTNMDLEEYTNSAADALPQGSCLLEEAPFNTAQAHVHGDAAPIPLLGKPCVTRGRKLGLQAKMLLGNALHRLNDAEGSHTWAHKDLMKQCPTKVIIEELCRRFPPRDLRRNRGRVTQNVQLIASLCNLPCTTVRNCWVSLLKRQHCPQRGAQRQGQVHRISRRQDGRFARDLGDGNNSVGDRDATSEPLMTQKQLRTTMHRSSWTTLCRVVLSNAVLGRARSSCLQDLL